MISNQKRIVLVATLLLVGVTCSCKGGRYNSKVNKLHSGMSRADVVAALGKPYGEANSMVVYYDPPASTVLAVQPNEGGDCEWLILEVPPGGIPEGYAYYKVRESSGAAPFAVGTRIFRVP